MNACDNYPNLKIALAIANRNNLTSCDKVQLHASKTKVEKIIRKLTLGMTRESEVFSKLFFKTVGVGSIYENTKIGKINEFDIDVVLKVPDGVTPFLEEEEKSGFVKVRLEHFEELSETNPQMYRIMTTFIDQETYLLSEEMMSIFVMETVKNVIRKQGTIQLENEIFRITKIEYIEPAITLTVEGQNFFVTVDFVASFLLKIKNQSFVTFNKQNLPPISTEVFLTPARPYDAHCDTKRLWRLSFHKQEKQLMLDCFNLKPALRVLKSIRDHFKQNVHSYALKTVFLWEMTNPEANFVWKSSLGFVVLYMLQRYQKYLQQQNIPNFWNPKCNLLSYLSDEDWQKYDKEINEVVDRIMMNSDLEDLLQYFKPCI